MKVLPRFRAATRARLMHGAAMIQAAVTVAIAALALCGSSPAAAQTITEYPIPTAASLPFGIAAGPDGAMWFVEAKGNKIGRITTDGTITEYPIPTANSDPQCIVAGPDGAMWFVEGTGNKVGRITTAGVITEFPVSAGGWPQCLAVGPDGALWIANQGPKGNGAATGDGWIGRMTTAGVGTNKFPVPTPNSQPSFIAAGSDGALWFTYADVNKIGRITTAGVVTEFAIPTPNSGAASITAGPDGALWFTENLASKIGRITTSGTITEFAAPANSNPGFIVAGPDGALWFTEPGILPTAQPVFTGGGQKIGRITVSGVVTEYAIPTANSTPGGLTAGPDGTLWFGEITGNKIAKLTFPPAQPAPPVPLDPNQTVTPPPATQAAYTVPSGQMPAAAVEVSATGTFGSASLKVTLDIVKVLPATFAASPAYNVYVVALVPGALLGSASPMFFVKPKAPGNWGPLASPIAAFLENVAQIAVANQVTIEILTAMNISSLAGTEIYIGYGTDGNEMLAAGRYRGVYKVQ